jgi:hypothetical protein
VSRSCAVECTSFDSTAYSQKCCTTNQCNNNLIESRRTVDRCYVCISSSSRNCADGNNLVDSDSQGCPIGNEYCMLTIQNGHVSRSCATTCTNYQSDGITNKCCTTPLCNDEKLDMFLVPQSNFLDNNNSPILKVSIVYQLIILSICLLNHLI